MKHLCSLITLVCVLHAGQSKPSHSGGYGGYSDGGYAPVGYHGPLAKTVVLSSGHIADTPEVSAAKHQHYSALAKAKSSASAHGYSGNDYDSYSDSGYGSSYGYGAGYGSYGSGDKYAPVGYNGPLAKTVVLPDGHIADTPEVAAAKHLHYSAIQKAKAEAYAHGGGYDGSYGSGSEYDGGYDSGSGYSSGFGHGGSSYGSSGGYGYDGGYGSGGYASSYGSYSQKYSGPLANPKVLKSGYLADTHDVSAARHAHLNAVAVTASEHAAKWANNYYH